MKSDKTIFGIIAVTMLVAGCMSIPSVGPDYEKPEIKMQDYVSPDAGFPTTNRTEIGEYKVATGADDVRALITTNEVTRWWVRFEDPVLESLVTTSVSNNLSFLMAQERMMASRWAVLGTYAAFLPKIGLNGAAEMQGFHPDTPSGAGRTVHRDMFTGSFDASWEIDIFGGSHRKTEAAWAEAVAAGWSVADAWVSLTAEVGRQYIALRTTQQRIAVARTNLVLQTETYDILKSRMDSGIGDELAVNQSKYVVDQTRAQIPPLLAQEEKLKNALAILTGTMPGALHEYLAVCPERDWLLEPGKLANAPLDMIRARPDVRVAERQLAAECAYVGVAKAQWFPKLYINGSLGLQSTSFDDFFHRDALVGSIGPAVSWPLFQGGDVYASVKAQEARMNEKLYNYELVLQKAFGEVRDAYSAYTQEYHRYQALQGAVKAAQDAVTISNDLYKNGLRDFTAVIDAQRSLLSLAEALVVSRGQITQDMISLYKALGGGLEIPEDAE